MRSIKTWFQRTPKADVERSLDTTNWDWRQYTSLAVHSLFGLIPLVYGTVSAWQFWYDMFGEMLTPSLIVGSVEAVAFVGLVLFIASVESPFTRMRHLLPFVSVVGVSYELHKKLAHNEWYIAVPLTFIVASIFMALLYSVYRTIEKLFEDPFALATKRADQELQKIALRMTRFRAEEHILRNIGMLPGSVTTLPEAPQSMVQSNAVQVNSALYPVYDAILSALPIDPRLNSGTIAQQLNKSPRLIQMRIKELVDMGVLENNNGIYAKNGVNITQV